MPTFDETQMPANLAAGAVGGPQFNTSVFPLSGGAESRNQNWLYPLHTWTVTQWMDDADDIAEMKAFFWEHGGKAIGFRFTDITDFEVATYQQFATGDGAKTQFQLNKAYGSKTRLIKKPVTGTLGIKVNGVVILEGASAGKFTCDYTTGIITFGTAPAAAAVISWIGEFDTPVRFDTDQLNVNFETTDVAHIDGLPLIELRNP